MKMPRVLPCLLLKGDGLVKTTRFKEARYIGDPRNAVRIFNEKEVDELILVDIAATPEGKSPQFDLIREIASEAFMPVAYGGGIRTIEDVRKIFACGVEKIVLGKRAVEDPNFVQEAARLFGNQSIIVCIDVKKSFLGSYEVRVSGGGERTGLDPIAFARRAEEMGAGEILVNSIDRDGTLEGYDIDLIRSVTKRVRVPVIASGGAGKIEDFRSAVQDGGASAVAAGSLFVFQGRHRAVLISYPSTEALKRVFDT